jgi:hypothetical protein
MVALVSWEKRMNGLANFVNLLVPPTKKIKRNGVFLNFIFVTVDSATSFVLDETFPFRSGAGSNKSVPSCVA